MSGKLDQSLDEIVSTQRRSARRGRGQRNRQAGKASTSPVATVGGVNKTVKQAKR
jgi:THO complex subunit 4